MPLGGGRGGGGPAGAADPARSKDERWAFARPRRGTPEKASWASHALFSQQPRPEADITHAEQAHAEQAAASGARRAQMTPLGRNGWMMKVRWVSLLFLVPKWGVNYLHFPFSPPFPAAAGEFTHPKMPLTMWQFLAPPL